MRDVDAFVRDRVANHAYAGERREKTKRWRARRIDPKDHVYDGSRMRRLPEGRK